MATTATEAGADPAVAHHLDELRREGFSVRHGALDEDLVSEAMAAVERMHGTWPRALVQRFHGHGTVRYFDLLNADPVFARLPSHPAVLPVVRAAIGDDCLLSTYGTASIGPGEPAQAIHADDVLFGLPRPHGDIFCNVMVALSDFTEDNGATRVVPGSHRWPADPEVRILAPGETDDRWPTVAAQMPRGSVCFFLGGTYHGGGANRTGAARHGITMAYCAGFLRPQEAFTLAVDQQRAASFDDDLLAVMGWRTSAGGLGHVYTRPEDLAGPLVHRLVSPQAGMGVAPPGWPGDRPS